MSNEGLCKRKVGVTYNTINELKENEVHFIKEGKHLQQTFILLKPLKLNLSI